MVQSSAAMSMNAQACADWRLLSSVWYSRRNGMSNRARDWFSQAERNLEQARASQGEGRHEWACFAAQQTAEMAAKALHLSLGQEAWGHVIARLLAELPATVDVPAARVSTVSR
jgi:HEPN domain-containing protein